MDALDTMFPAPEEVPTEPVVAQELPVEPEVVEPVEPVAPEPEPVPQREDAIPLAKYLDQRDELKEAKRRLAEFEATQRPAPAVPDALDDPEGYNAYMGQQLQSALQAQKVDMSWAFAVQQHGQDTAEAARTWALEKAQKDPAFHAALDTAFVNQPMPIEWIVQQHKRDALLSDIGDVSKLDDWFAREAAKRGYAQQSAPLAVAPANTVAATPQPALKPAVPPRSIASDVSPAAAPSDPTAEFNAIFKR